MVVILEIYCNGEKTNTLFGFFSQLPRINAMKMCSLGINLSEL